MKKIAVILTAVAACLTAYGQGKLTLANSTATAITNSVTMLKAPTTSIVVGVYYSANLSATEAEMTFSGPFAPLLAPGVFSAGTKSIAGTMGGDTVLIQIRAWSAGYATYEDAFRTGLASVLEGKSNMFPLTLGGLTAGGSTLPTPGITQAGRMGAFLVNPVPEPSTIALGLLGLAGLLFIRRRK